MPQSQPENPRLVLALAQSIALPRDVEENVRRHVRLAEMAAAEGARMVLFPELSLTGYSLALTSADALTPDDERLEPLRAVAREGDIVIVAGGPVASHDGLYIGALILTPDGVNAIHTKEYLHPGEEVAFIPGRGGDPFPLGDEMIGLAVCADITHPEHACAVAERGATVYAAGCFITPTGYDVDTAFLRRYAVDHGMLVLMANYGGPTDEFSCAGKSAFWSDRGELLVSAPDEGEALCIAERSEGEWRGRVVIGMGDAGQENRISHTSSLVP